MPRAFSLALKAYLAGEVLALTNCVRIVRLDGTQWGFTSLDADLVINGLTYHAFTSADVSEIASSIGSGVDNGDLVALLDSEAVTETDLLAGLWDGASVELFFWPFENETLGRMLLVTGTIGEITDDGGQFTAEVRSLSQRLSQQFIELTSLNCRVRAFGDRQCMPKGFNEGTNGSVPTGTITLAGVRNTRAVTVVNSPLQITFGAEPAASTIFRYSPLVFVTGLNAGISREVKEHTAGGGSTAVLTLQEAFPYEVAVGDTAVLERGCNRTLAQCTALHGNDTNFAGEPHIPGDQAVLKRGKR